MYLDTFCTRCKNHSETPTLEEIGENSWVCSFCGRPFPMNDDLRISLLCEQVVLLREENLSLVGMVKALEERMFPTDRRF